MINILIGIIGKLQRSVVSTLASQSSAGFPVCRVLFCKENKNSNVDNFLPEFDVANYRPS